MLQTVLTEVEALINDRSLTYVSVEDLPRCNTNAQTLTWKTYQCHMCQVADDIIIQQRELLDLYWSRWRNEYLTTLRQQHLTTVNNNSFLKAGEIVFMMNWDLARSNWKLAVIKEMMSEKEWTRTSCGNKNDFLDHNKTISEDIFSGSERSKFNCMCKFVS